MLIGQLFLVTAVAKAVSTWRPAQGPTPTRGGRRRLSRPGVVTSRRDAPTDITDAAATATITAAGRWPPGPYPKWVMPSPGLVRACSRSSGAAGLRYPAGHQRRDRETTDEAYPSSAARGGEETSGGAAGVILFAAIMMIMVGRFQFFEGLVAIFNDTFYVATRNYLFQFDATTWGWIHLILGLVVALAGWGLLSGRTWARGRGITVALVSAVANFLWLPYYPFWALTIITLDVFVISPSPPTAASCGNRSDRGG